MKKILLILLLMILNVYANIGNITFVNGKIDILRQGKSFSVKLGDSILSKDIISTGKNSKMQIVFNDKTVITVGSKAKFSVDEYYYNKDKSKENKLSMNFLNGFFKTITGQIGKLNPSNFNLNTKTASIGIRGTQISMTTSPKAGDFIACTSGEISVSSLQTGTSVIVPAGMFTSIKPGSTPTKPKAYSKKQLSQLSSSESSDSNDESEENSDSDSQTNTNATESVSNTQSSDDSVAESIEATISKTIEAAELEADVALKAALNAAENATYAANTAEGATVNTTSIETAEIAKTTAENAVKDAQDAVKKAENAVDEIIKIADKVSTTAIQDAKKEADEAVVSTKEALTRAEDAVVTIEDKLAELNKLAEEEEETDSNIDTTNATKQVEYNKEHIKMGYWINDSNEVVGTYIEGERTQQSKIREYIRNDIKAEYSGPIRAIHTYVDGTSSAVGGTAILDVDFGKRRINGEFVIGSTDWKVKISDINMNSNGFNTNNIENNGSSTEGTTGKITGRFYGSNAEDMGGSIDINSTNNGSVKGHYGAAKQ